MTTDQFNNTFFGAKDKVLYQNIEYPILALDFEENLIGIQLKSEIGVK